MGLGEWLKLKKTRALIALLALLMATQAALVAAYFFIPRGELTLKYQHSSKYGYLNFLANN